MKDVYQVCLVRIQHSVVLFLLLSFTGAFAQSTNVQLILDASGSMFNRLADGEYRIVAAKNVLRDFVSGLPADEALNVGLRVYGSRLAALEDGACLDSELFVDMNGVARDNLLDTIRDTQARGATPIAYSLEQAAGDFPSSGRNVIVLVTDGEESCGGDVRGVLEAMRARGIEVELSIIGFDLDDAAIRSFEGLGTFENATSAQELASALGRAVEVADTQTYPVTVLLTRDGLPTTDGAIVNFNDAVTGSGTSFTMQEAGRFTATLPSGAYEAVIGDAFSDVPQTLGGLSVTPEGDNTFSFELAQASSVTLSLATPMPTAGGNVTVSFEGAPTGEGNWITVVPADIPDSDYLDWSYVTGASGTVDITLPADVMTLEARYHVELPEGGSRVIGRSEVFTSVMPIASLTPPAEVEAGTSFPVTWSGPNNNGDYVTIVPAGAPEGAYTSYFYTSSSSANLTAPGEAGSYEVRYVLDADNRTLVSVPITVTAAESSLSVAESVMAGSSFEVTWSGPNGNGDYVTIVPTGAPEGAYTSYFYTSSGSPGTLTAPIEAGSYEVRYVLDAGNATVTSMPIMVSAAQASLEAPSQVTPGADFSVTWSGPNGNSDYVTIVPAGAPEGSYTSYFYTSVGATGSLTAPDTAGSYEVRYVSAQGDVTITSVPVTVR
ncbi:MAG: VWA domain-containing protein [Deinococcota bacterium]